MRDAAGAMRMTCRGLDQHGHLILRGTHVPAHSTLSLTYYGLAAAAQTHAPAAVISPRHAVSLPGTHFKHEKKAVLSAACHFRT